MIKNARLDFFGAFNSDDHDNNESNQIRKYW